MLELDGVVCIMERMTDKYVSCTLCRRNCTVNREKNNNGYCGETSRVKLASAGIHFGEEPVLTGNGGSGTFFFTGCTMKCPFCQNWQISHKGMGTVIDEKTFSTICIRLAEEGAENINLVTPSHFAPTISEWIAALKKSSFSLPFIWNSSGFDTVSVLEMVMNDIDVFLPDMKTLSPSLSRYYFNTGHYPAVVKEGLLFLAEKKPLEYSSSGLLTQGTIVRHLVMPGNIENSKEVLRWYAENLQGKMILSVMTQYTPVTIPENTIKTPKRSLDKNEYEEILAFINSIGIDDGFIQEWEEEQSSDWLPDFSARNSFPSGKSKTIWNWREGFLR